MAAEIKAPVVSLTTTLRGLDFLHIANPQELFKSLVFNNGFKPNPYQSKTVVDCLQRPQIIADEMGLGKTAQMIMSLVAFFENECNQLHQPSLLRPINVAENESILPMVVSEKRVSKKSDKSIVWDGDHNLDILITGPLSCIDRWISDIRTICPRLLSLVWHCKSSLHNPAVKPPTRCRIALVAISTFQASAKYYKLYNNNDDDSVVRKLKPSSSVPWFVRTKWTIVAADEAHFLARMHMGEAAPLICRVMDSLNYDRGYVMTATPIQNHQNDLVSLFMFILKSTSEPARFKLFWARKVKNDEQLRLKRLYITRRDVSIIGLLPIKYEPLLIKPSQFQIDLINKYLVASATRMKSHGTKNAMDILVMIKYLQLACSMPYLVPSNPPDLKERKAARLERKEKIKTLKTERKELKRQRKAARENGEPGAAGGGEDDYPEDDDVLTNVVNDLDVVVTNGKKLRDLSVPELFEIAPKLKVLFYYLNKEVMGEGATHKMLVFSFSIKTMFEIARVSELIFKYRPPLFYGQTPIDERTRLVKEYQEYKIPFMVMSVKAGGLSSTLTAADRVFFVDDWYNPQLSIQADGRANRIGQTKQVVSYRPRMDSVKSVELWFAFLQREKLLKAAKVLPDLNKFHDCFTPNMPKINIISEFATWLNGAMADLGVMKKGAGDGNNKSKRNMKRRGAAAASADDDDDNVNDDDDDGKESKKKSSVVATTNRKSSGKKSSFNNVNRKRRGNDFIPDGSNAQPLIKRQRTYMGDFILDGDIGSASTSAASAPAAPRTIGAFALPADYSESIALEQALIDSMYS